MAESDFVMCYPLGEVAAKVDMYVLDGGLSQ